MKRLTAFFLGLIAAIAVLHFDAARSAAIDEKVLASVYHQGLKSFYAGDYRQSVETLTQAIDGGSKDPSAHYFRGLAQSRLGRTAEAQADFTRGAELEGQDFDVFYNVSQALERIQGQERRALETYRAAGRKNALAAVEKIRLEQFRRFDPAQAAASSPAATEAVPAEAAPSGAPNPFDAQPAAPAMPAAQPAGADPFGTPAAPAAAQPLQPAGAPASNPFGAPPTPNPPATPATPSAPAANPFGS